MRSNSIYLILLVLALCAEASNFREQCRAALHRGRTTIEKHVPALVQEEHVRLRQKLSRRMEEMFKAELLHDSLGLGKYMVQAVSDVVSTTPNPCPAPNRTMFTTPAPPTTTSATTFCSSTTTSPMSQSTSAGTSGTVPSATTVSDQTAPTAAAPTASGGTGAAQTASAPAQASSSTSASLAPSSANAAVGDDNIATTTTSSSASQQTTSSRATTSSTASKATASSGSSASSSTSGSTTTSGTSASQATTLDNCVPAQQAKEFSKPFTVPTMFTSNTDDDPFHQWISTIYGYMFKTEEICDQPPIKDLNSITEDQLYGFFATLSAAHPGPFCSLCDHFVSETLPRVFSVHPLWEEDERYLMRLLYANIPSAKALCSTIAPACYESYELATRNITEALVCMECSACMTLGNVIQHSFLLDKEMVAGFLRFLRSSLFHNTCAELCLVWQPLNLTLFPNGFTYDGCMNFLTDSYQTVIDIATVILRPERFCSLELHWCELNEAPNILHCLRELCVESLKDTPQAAWLCSQIPDTPSMADQFLNVHQTKRYKTRRPYHDKYEKGMTLHDEL